MKQKKNKALRRIIITMAVVTTLILCNVLFTMVTQKHFRSGVNVKDYKEPSISNQSVIKANRGTIYDRNGSVIAQDEDTYTIIAYMDSSRVGIGDVPAYIQDIPTTAKKLATVLDMKKDSIEKILTDAKADKLYQTELGIKGKNLAPSVKDKIEEMNLQGIGFVKTVNRNYPNGTFASHLIGYAQYDEEEQKIVGKMGLEATLNSYLVGEDGLEIYQKDVKGNVLPGTKYTESYAKNGNDVYLTLDTNVQLALQSSLQKTMKEVNAEYGWGLVMEVETGKILGWGSLPTFDLNTHDAKDNWLNIPSDYLYEPGSAMKGITYAAAIDSGNYPYNKTYRSGVFYFGTDENGKIYRSQVKVGGVAPIYDALHKDHGTLTFDKGFVLSSNIAICEILTNYMDPSIYKDYVEKFGFRKEVDIPFVSNQVGNMNFTYASEQLNTGFGQGLSITALQMAQAYTAIFNDGTMVRPYVVEKIKDSNTGEIVEEYTTKAVGTPISKATSEYVRKLMKAVVDDDDGTGHRYQMDDVSVIAKTGTGEIANENGVYGDTYTNSVMAAAPADDPKIMIYYVFQSKDYLNYTGDPFKEVMKAALVAENISGESDTNENTSKQTFSKWKEYTMPSLVNHTSAYVDQKLEDMEVETVMLGNGNSVIRQYPQAGTTIVSGQRVFLLTEGSTLKMPNMIGWTKKDLTAFWMLTGISIEMEGNGSVTKQNIKSGKTIGENSSIVVTME